MGCGASKGKEESNTTQDLSFKYLGVYEVDEFFRKVKNLVDAFKDATAPYDEARDDLYDSSKFYEVPGASILF